MNDDDKSAETVFLFDAVKLGDCKSVRNLAFRHADINARMDDGTRRTPLHVAISRCDPSMVRTLITRGADVNARDARGLTPLHFAAAPSDGAGSHANQEIVELLLEKGADPLLTSNRKRTASNIARQSGNFVVAEKLAGAMNRHYDKPTGAAR